jgi:hypothetical protein
MLTLTPTQFVNKFKSGQRNQEVQVEPIEVRSCGRTVGYYVSPHEFQEIQTIKSQMRKFYTPATMPARYWDAIASETPNPADAHLDKLLEGKEARIFFPGDPDYPAGGAETKKT